MARASGKTGTATFASKDIKGMTKWTLNYEADLPEVTGMDSNGAAAFISGITRWSGNISGYYEGTSGGSLGTVTPGASGAISLLTHTGGKTYSGTALVKSCNAEVDVGGAIAFSIDFQGTGALTIT